MDKYGIDSHKLHYHVARVNDWLQGEIIAPIYMEVSPSGACNHRCVFCALDFMKYQPVFLDTEILKRRLTEMARLGLKALMFAGEGEPLLHPDICSISQHCVKNDLDIAFTSNGVLFTKDVAEQLLPISSWIKISCNAGTQQTYSQLHRCKEEDFNRVFHNLEAAVQLRSQNRHQCTIGLQTLLLPENSHEVIELALRCKEVGLDYLVVKPYSQHPESKTQRYAGIEYKAMEHLAASLEAVATESFAVIFRKETMENWDRGAHNYQKCLALPFWSYLDAKGNVHGCSMHMNNENFLYGNIYSSTFEEIWVGKKRQQSLQWVNDNLDPQTCRVNCRMDKINNYLWKLVHPPAHKNFI